MKSSESAAVQNYNLSFSGGDEKYLYAISANYFDQQGIIINSDFKRYNARINVDRNITEDLKIGNSFHSIKNSK